MAIYHLEAKAVSRGSGRSAVAAAAYMSCSEIHNEYDGVTHDFTRKRGLVWQQVFLPKNAPPEWKDRNVLWNAVEAAEKSKDSRLARELVVALPIELDKTQWLKLLTEYIQENFVVDGMCADVAIHDTDGHNPHAHILLTVRPLDDKGKWQNKTEKEYLCVKNGEEKGFTATEFLQAKEQGWEKQYQYFIGKKKVYLPPSEAKKHGYERVNKYPKSTRFGRQNPIAARWNSDEQLFVWREQWAQITNNFLDEANRADAHIDHRSHAARGLDEQPTIHEGYVARTIEQKGLVADRCAINRQIKADNALLRDLKSAMKKITQTVKNTLPALAEAMETLREKMIVIRYHLQAGSAIGQKAKRRVRSTKATLAQYTAVAERITAKKKERKELQNQKKSTPVLRITIQRDLSRQIAKLTEEIEELRSEKLRLLNELKCADDKDIPKVQSEIAKIESTLATMEKANSENSSKLLKLLSQYKVYRERAKSFNPAEFMRARLKLRPAKEQSAEAKLKAAYGKNFDEATFYAGIRDTDTANADHLAAQPTDKASATQNTHKPHIK
ncbi:MAG: MobQ family relaxase [Ruminococcus sp.]|nr:MobQ family relaxase [Ruminococcus sp.]